MKHINSPFKALAVFVLLVCSLHAGAQLRIGARAGLNISNMAQDPAPATDPASIMGFHLGAFAEYMISEDFGVEGGLLFSTKGSKKESSIPLGGGTITHTSTLGPKYLEIPINVVYKLDLDPVKIIAFTGPYIGIGVGGTIKDEYTGSGLPSGNKPSSYGYNDSTMNITYGSDITNLKRMDIGANIGVGAEFMNFQLRFQYGAGISNLVNVSNTTVKNRVIAISVCYLFGESR